MKVTIEHTDVKRRQGTLYNVTCALVFSEEERAIIRERSLGGNKFAFEHGYVNHPEGADSPVSPQMLRIGSRLLFLIGLPLTYFSPPLATLCWFGAAGLFLYRRNLEGTLGKVGQDSITLAQVLRDGSFTVTAFGSPLEAQQVDAEIRTNLDGLKNMMAASAEIPKVASFEM
jgi:hypothetical protein